MMAMPPNFSWVVEGLLAASAFPSKEEHYMYMQQQGISKVISLTEKPIDSKKGNIEFEVIHISVKDFTAPTFFQVDEFVDQVESSEKNRQAMVVHCQMGRGRTGTMAACYLVFKQDLTGVEAINSIRRLRPGSIETAEQEQLVHKYLDHLKNKCQ